MKRKHLKYFQDLYKYDDTLIPCGDLCFSVDRKEFICNERQVLQFISIFKKSQAKIKNGFYFIKIVDLSKIDVVFKNIANRKFFYWDKDIDESIDWIKEYFDDLPPVILEELNGLYYSVDGHHRITGALEMGKQTILAFTTEVTQLTHIRNN